MTDMSISTDLLKAKVVESVTRRVARLVELSHAIHDTPELAFNEVRSSRTLAEAAEKEGLSVTRSAFGLETALACEFGPEGGPVIGIISEYDALPNIGHACGHNIIGVAGLGAVLALADLREALPGRIRWIGTPAEERGCGKELMARAGAFENLDVAMMVHPAGIDAKAVRTLCIAEAEVLFRGTSAHAAVNPDMGRNALDAAVGAYQAVAALRQHLPPRHLINGVIIEGGTAPNVIPERARCSYFVRAPSGTKLAVLKVRFEAAMRAGALGSGCDVEINWCGADYLDYKMNLPLADAYEANAHALGRTKFVPVENLPLGGTDMGNVSHRVPALHPLICSAPSNVHIHDPAFAVWARSEKGNAAVLDGAKALAMTAIDVLTRPDLRIQIREDFAATAERSREAVSAVEVSGKNSKRQ